MQIFKGSMKVLWKTVAWHLRHEYLFGSVGDDQYLVIYGISGLQQLANLSNLLLLIKKDNVANQREHLILLLANVHMRQLPKPDQLPKLDDRALTEVMKKLFKNYKKWCKYLGGKSSLWLPTIQQQVHQRKLLYVGLYLLIRGEATNLRFMPECLCYIYHRVSIEFLLVRTEMILIYD